MKQVSSDMSTIRLLECWLPLVQTLNQEQQWGYDSDTLEAIICTAAVSLNLVHTVLAARAILLAVGKEYARR